MEIVKSNLDDEKKNKIIKFVKESLKQNERVKAGYVRDKLKKFYPNEIWTVIYYIFDRKALSYSYDVNGTKLYCNYKNYQIRITSNKRNNKELNNDAYEEGDFEKLEEDIGYLNKKISDIKIIADENEKIIEKYKLLIIEKDKEIETLKNELEKNKQDNSSVKAFYARDQILALNFVSSDSRLHFAIPCINKDLFVDVEKKLYDEFPDYKETNNNFIVQGKIILRFKTIEENQLKSGIPIIIIQNNNN